MVNKFQIILFSSLVGLASCGNSTPKCSDKKVVSLVKKTIHEQLFNAYAEKAFPSRQRAYYTKEKLEEEMLNLQKALYEQYPMLFDLDKVEYKINSIRTIQSDGKINICASSFRAYDKKEKKLIGTSAPVNYSVQLTDDGREIIVSLID